MKCKYVEQNRKEMKCSDYYISHKNNDTVYMCRLKEWKKKCKVCPYNNTIFSVNQGIKQAIKNKEQKEIKLFTTE